MSVQTHTVYVVTVTPEAQYQQAPEAGQELTHFQPAQRI